MTTFLKDSDFPDQAVCSMCGKFRYIMPVEVYQNAGRKLRLEYLCYEVIDTNTGNPAQKLDNCCYYKYNQHLRFQLVVSDWYQQTYDAILSIFISSPLLRLLQQAAPSIPPQHHQHLKGGGGAITFETAVHVSYAIDPVVRSYLDAVDRKKVPDVLNIEANPRIWSIRYRLTNLEPLVTKVSDEPLIFRWSRNK